MNSCVALALLSIPGVAAASCDVLGECNAPPQVAPGQGTLEASYFELRQGIPYASNVTLAEQPYMWRLSTPCQITDPNIGACVPGQAACPDVPGRVLSYRVVQ